VNAAEAVAAALAGAPGALGVSSLGTATSALRLASGDGPHLYLGGAMGCGLAAALGVADARPEREVLAILGDGDLLMGAGSLFALAGLAPRNLRVLVLDDGRYSITGGQEVAGAGSLAAVAAALPGVACARAGDPDGVTAAVAASARPGIVLAAVGEHVWPGPSPFVDPAWVRARFGAHARGG
jgi:thiamine pyrophosphate-dependent acetolactate synthase large subunit-like protein